MPIEGSPHSIVGRLDEIVEWNGGLWVGEAKTANMKETLPKLQERWRTNKQADFVLIGAAHLGYAVEGVLVRAIVEKHPPIILPVVVKRTSAELDRHRLAVHQTAELIEFMRASFGIDQPWPHLTGQWPCAVAGKCAYENLCGKVCGQWDTAEMEKFKRREEHLELLKGASGAV